MPLIQETKARVRFWAIPASDLLTDLAESRVSARCNTKSVNLESVVNSVSHGRPWYNPAIEHDLRECGSPTGD